MDFKVGGHGHTMSLLSKGFKNAEAKKHSNVKSSSKPNETEGSRSTGPVPSRPSHHLWAHHTDSGQASKSFSANFNMEFPTMAPASGHMSLMGQPQPAPNNMRTIGQPQSAASNRRTNFTRLFSSSSLQSQTIPEEAGNDAALTRRERYNIKKSCSFPCQFDYNDLQRPDFVEFGGHDHSEHHGTSKLEQWRMEQIRLRNGSLPMDPNHMKCHMIQQPSSQSSTETSISRIRFPTIILVTGVSAVMCFFSYLCTHTFTLSDVISTVHTHAEEIEAELSDYSLVYLLHSLQSLAKESGNISYHNFWIMGPLLLGITVSAVTWRVLYPPVGRSCAHRPDLATPETCCWTGTERPSLQLGKVVSVLNGILLGLYFLFYNLKVKQVEK